MEKGKGKDAGVIIFRVSDLDRDIIDAIAQREGVTMSEVIRRGVRREVDLLFSEREGTHASNGS